MTGTQTRIVLARLPQGVPVVEDFTAETVPIPQPGEGSFLARTVLLSLDPYVRSAIAGRHPGHAASSPGDLVPGRGVARVIESRHAGFAEGELLVVETGWQEFLVSDGRNARLVDVRMAPASTALGVLGMPGLTAWAGITSLAAVRPGETVVVSAAAGAVGSAAGQIARIGGARVVGIAGSREKCALATGTCGLHACVNYRQEGWQAELRRATDGSVHVYFDNVGGPILDAVMDLLAPGGRVVLCGLIGQYNTGVPLTVPLASIIKRRARLMGLVVYDHEHLFPEYLATASAWVRDGRMRYVEDRAIGLEAAPAAFHRLMTGANVGKSIVVVTPEDPDA
jgi:NADPH-dependent curcumin reductase CurA